MACVHMTAILSCSQDPATGEVHPKPSNEPKMSQEEVIKSSTEEPMPSLEATSISVTQEQPTDEPQTDESRKGSEQKVVA